MKKLYYFLVIIFLTSVQAAQGQPDQPFARFPTVSPDGSHIAFSYQGDIWTASSEGGRALRLTVHEAYESRPRWSPNGEHIAFISDRHGNDDLFVMDADGSNIHRRTYHSTADKLTGWTNDNKLIFTTERLFNQVEWEPEIQTVSADGGTPTRFFDAFGLMASMSPDGRFLVFVRGYNKEYRKRYRGPANKDLWIYDTKNQSYRQLTNFKGNDMYPVFGDNNTLYFLSERSGVHNLYKTQITDQGTLSSSPQKLTDVEEDGIRYFDISSDGQTIIVEHKAGLYTVDGDEVEALPLQVSQDDRYYNIERKSLSSKTEEFAVSPDGKLLAFVIKGEIFVKQNDPKKKQAVKVTDHPYRDRDVAFINNTTLVFASDRNGQYDLYSLQPEKGKKGLFKSLRYTTSRLTSTPEAERKPVVSHGGKKVVFNRGRGKLVIGNISNPTKITAENILLDTDWATAEDVSWSPDDQWLAYALPDLDFNTEIYIHPTDNSREPVNISKHPRPDTNPVWSPDGSKLAFLSSRNNGDDDLWFAWLNKRDWQQTELDWEQSQTPEKVSPEDTANVRVNIDFDDIYKRLDQVTSLPGNESDIVISKDGQTFYFVSNRDSRQNYNADQDIYRVNWNGKKLKALTNNNKAPHNLRLVNKLNAIYLMQKGGKIGRYNLKKNKLENFPFQTKLAINHRKQREQIFEEAWRTLNNGFYDPDFHGQNWQEIHDHYKPWALHTSSDRDFQDVMNMMLGELNASHMGFSGPDRAQTQDVQTGLLGITVEIVKSGAKITYVLPKGPADREVSTLKVGEVITHVDGQPVPQTENFYSLLTDKANTPTLLTVQSVDGQNRDVVIEPARSLRSERYNAWVEKRKKLTNKYSNGRLGYLHIEGMNWPSFERFERELVATGEGKDGIVIDVRYNGGGWTTDYLLTVLNYRQHAYTIPRGATPDLQKNKTKFRNHYPFGERLPLSSWTREAITLANQNSYSNAEIFAHAFKQLNLGTLVGEPTFGAVISTGGKRLMGGSYIRLPFRGWYVKNTDENMEHGPAIPDIEVDNPPNYRSGEDIQLKQAVKVLLKQIDRK